MFEDGTLNFLDIVGLRHGECTARPSDRSFLVFWGDSTARAPRGGLAGAAVLSTRRPPAGLAVLQTLGGIRSVERHVACVTDRLYERMEALGHSNGEAMIRVLAKPRNGRRCVARGERPVAGCWDEREIWTQPSSRFLGSPVQAGWPGGHYEFRGASARWDGALTRAQRATCDWSSRWAECAHFPTG